MKSNFLVSCNAGLTVERFAGTIDALDARPRFVFVCVADESSGVAWCPSRVSFRFGGDAGAGWLRWVKFPSDGLSLSWTRETVSRLTGSSDFAAAESDSFEKLDISLM